MLDRIEDVLRAYERAERDWLAAPSRATRRRAVRCLHEVFRGYVSARRECGEDKVARDVAAHVRSLLLDIPGEVGHAYNERFDHDIAPDFSYDDYGQEVEDIMYGYHRRSAIVGGLSR